MLNSMTNLAKPNHFEFKFVAFVVMSFWLALFHAFRAMFRSKKISGFDCVMNGVVSLDFFRMLFPSPSLFFSRLIRIGSSPIAFKLPIVFWIERSKSFVFISDFFRVVARPFFLVSGNFLCIAFLPFFYTFQV